MSVARVRRMTWWRSIACAAVATVVLLGAGGCHHRRNTARKVPPQALPPELPRTPQPPTTATAPAKIPVTPVPPGGVSDADLDYVATHQPLMSQVGYATWYTAPYKGRRAANGEVFDDDAMTAANRTLPMGSLVVVTNLKTGQSSAMRITDRGPFVEDRMLDLDHRIRQSRRRLSSRTRRSPHGRLPDTQAYRYGRAMVRADRRVPRRTGSAGTEGAIIAQVSGGDCDRVSREKSFWVRIRPQGDDRTMAEYIARHIQPLEGDAYLTRLD